MKIMAHLHTPIIAAAIAEKSMALAFLFRDFLAQFIPTLLLYCLDHVLIISQPGLEHVLTQKLS